MGHPIKPLSDVRRTDPRSAQIGGPNFIAQTFQVSPYSGEPFTSKRARNLFSKRDCRVAESDEVAKEWPEVSGVFCSELFAGLRERLTGARAGSHGLVVRPSGELECERPSADAGEEMVLDIISEFVGSYFADASGVYEAIWNLADANEFPQPEGRFRIALIVIVHRSFANTGAFFIA